MPASKRRYFRRLQCPGCLRASGTIFVSDGPASSRGQFGGLAPNGLNDAPAARRFVEEFERSYRLLSNRRVKRSQNERATVMTEHIADPTRDEGGLRAPPGLS